MVSATAATTTKLSSLLGFFCWKVRIYSNNVPDD